MATETAERAQAGAGERSAARASLSLFIGEQRRLAGADGHLLIDASSRRDEARVLTCNWVYDAVADAGIGNIASIVRTSAAAMPGAPARPHHPLGLAALAEQPRLARLAHHGHQEFYILTLPSAQHRLHLMLSSGKPGRIVADRLPHIQMTCIYALSRFLPETGRSRQSTLSERELECLSWVSQGKTAGEIALILDCTANTINSHVAHAIHKLNAKNRAMAIATAIRLKLI